MLYILRNTFIWKKRFSDSNSTINIVLKALQKNFTVLKISEGVSTLKAQLRNGPLLKTYLGGEESIHLALHGIIQKTSIIAPCGEKMLLYGEFS